jgi:hypothetical protein
VSVAGIAAAWLVTHPDGASEAEASAWLQSQGLSGPIAQAIRPVLEELWSAAWAAGAKAAGGVASSQALQSLLGQLSAKWVAQIVSTTLKILAAALAKGADLVAALKDAERAASIALTEAVRVMAAAAAQIYSDSGVLEIEWVCFPGCCPACQENADAGPWPLGVPFPSGAILPPDHVRCRCAIVPADSEKHADTNPA